MTSYHREPRTRRPRALYGIVGLVIVAAAAYLFWPRNEQAPTQVFTQEGFDAQGVDTVDSSELVHDLGGAPEPAATTGSQPGDAAGGTYGEIVGAQELSEPPPAIVHELGTTSEAEAAPAATTRPQRVGPTGIRTGPAPATAVPEPSVTGAYQVWLGSFQSRDNAQRRVRELAGAGVEATIIPVDTPNAGQVYRVRVGFFRDVNAARQFGDAMKRELDIAYWVDRR